MIAFQPWIREETSRLYKVENIENLLDISDIHVQNLSDNARQMKTINFQKENLRKYTDYTPRVYSVYFIKTWK